MANSAAQFGSLQPVFMVFDHFDYLGYRKTLEHLPAPLRFE